MTLKTQMATDMKEVFLNSDEFAESITYTPYGGSAKTINAVILRERLLPNGVDAGRSVGRDAEILIANDSTEGVTSVTYRGPNLDTVSFPVNQGGTAVNWKVVDVLGKDDAAWHLKVTKAS